MKYRVVKSKRRSLCLRIEKNGEVLVRAPYFVSENEIAEFVQKHERWISSHLEKLSKRRSLNLSDHETIVLFGNSYIIEEGKPAIADGKITLPAINRSAALLKLVKALASKELTKLVEELCINYNFTYTRVRISQSRTRWGSCSKEGVLSFTYALAFIPPELVYYVAVHELCHTRQLNHSKKFWDEVEKILPEWRKLRSSLRKEEDCLDYLRDSQE